MKTNTHTKIFKSVCESNVHRPLPITLCLVLCTLVLVLSVNAGGTTPTIITFDAPGAGTAAGQGTIAFCLNPSGAIAGFTRDANNARHGFLRAPDGTFTIIDDPAAGTCSTNCGAIGNGQGTRAYAINPSGVITGFFTDNSARCHGFLRAPDGTFTQIDAPDAGAGPFPQGTFPSEITPMGINPAGAVTGFYVDANSVQHGFVRAPGGQITEFDPTGSIFSNPNAIDQVGDITGFYFDATTAVHGFLRDKKGVVTSFDILGGGTGLNQGTYAGGFTSNGGIMGVLIDANTVNHGFLLDKHGAVTTFDAPHAGTGFDQGTLPWGINTNGSITGWYVDNANVHHGFVRDRHGALTEFDVPGAGTGLFQGTTVYNIAPNGAVAGYYLDSNNTFHGFVREQAGH